MRTLIVGNGGRESALALRMAEHSEVHAFVAHANPTIVRHTQASGGSHAIGDVCDADAVAAFARERDVDVAMVSADEPLAAGVIDALLAQGTRAVGPTRAGAEIEWNKAFARELLAEIAPEAVPALRIVRAAGEVEEAIASFEGAPLAVKPAGLTGGKGVKVMGPHLASHAEASDYALKLLAERDEPVLIEERVTGAEFTIQAISDGRTVVFPPSTYDYPYRFDGDQGPGTGGMGSLSLARATLPFMSQQHYDAACSIVERVIERLSDEGRHFSGVMNSGFFATADGVRVIEFNARFGDPECMNVMSLFQGSWPDAMESISAARLSADDVPLREEASVVLYLVSPDYALGAGADAAQRSGVSTAQSSGAAAGSPQPCEFELDQEAIEADGCHVFFSAAVQVGAGAYRTVGTSRVVALASTAPELEQARLRVAGCARSVPVLQWRRDVGDERYLLGLSELVERQPA